MRIFIDAFVIDTLKELDMPNWQYDEFKHCGVDYAKAEQAEAYDERHQKFRNYEQEFHDMLDFLDLNDTREMSLIDLGCGTGATAIYAAQSFERVYAVDVSEVMIVQARRKVDASQTNLTFIQAGFLTYEHADDPVDLVMTKVAFHHLPDFWKQIALLRMNRMLKSQGLLYLHDVVFQFEPQDYIERISGWIEGFVKVTGEKFQPEVETHIRDEYSTFGWILEQMLDKAGFAIEQSRSPDGFITEYACRKVRAVEI